MNSPKPDNRDWKAMIKEKKVQDKIPKKSSLIFPVLIKHQSNPYWRKVFKSLFDNKIDKLSYKDDVITFHGPDGSFNLRVKRISTYELKKIETFLIETDLFKYKTPVILWKSRDNLSKLALIRDYADAITSKYSLSKADSRDLHNHLSYCLVHNKKYDIKIKYNKIQYITPSPFQIEDGKLILEKNQITCAAPLPIKNFPIVLKLY